MCIVCAHCFHYHVVHHGDTLFHQNLLAVGTLFKTLAQFQSNNDQRNGDDQRRDGGLCNGDTAKDGNGKINKRAGDIQIHVFDSPDFRKNSPTKRIGRVKTRGRTTARELQSPLLINANKIIKRSPMRRRKES